ncbi:MAG TPA: hypothetical protein VD971_02445 [Phycisphaerales bacterium]|nr:hypothetical protein [Phycisphaerales bacterium]
MDRVSRHDDFSDLFESARFGIESAEALGIDPAALDKPLIEPAQPKAVWADDIFVTLSTAQARYRALWGRDE